METVKQAILLAGGKATRLGPITRVTNKHLLPVFDKPMILYGLEMLSFLGVERVTIILGGNSVGDVVNLVQDGNEFGLKVTYIYQSEAKGISHAILLAEHTMDRNKFLVVLGDNVFGEYEIIKSQVDEWAKSDKKALIVLTPSDHPQDYGQPIYEKGKGLKDFVEKSKKPLPHDWIVTGLYGFDHTAFTHIRTQKPSQRGELEVVDTLRYYIPDITEVFYNGFWTDCGTPKGMIDADNWFYRNSTEER